MLFSRLFLLVCSLAILIGCTGLTSPTTAPSSQIDDDNIRNGGSSSGLLIQTQTVTYDAVRIAQIINDTVTVIPYPYWNVESHQFHIDEIVSIVVPKERGNLAKGFTIGFSIGFTTIGILGLMQSEYNDDYSAYLMLSGLGGLVMGGLGGCLGGISDMGSSNHFHFREMTKPQKIQQLNNIIKHHQ
jgi:hypothetical protein